jgi:hypothetical protein
MSATLEPIITRVARCGERDYRFSGWSVFGDLLGRESFLGLVALGLTGRRLAPEEVALLDDLAVVLTAADPRIWVPKVTRLSASLGSSLAGASCGLLCTIDARIGSSVARESAELLTTVRISVGPEREYSLVKERIQAVVADCSQLSGFGVPYRKSDARFIAMMERIKYRGFENHQHCRLVDPLVEAVSDLKPGLAPNVVLSWTAACLDLGFEPGQIAPLIAIMLMIPTVANAFEESVLMSPALRELPFDAIDYRGAPPRPSPRASAASASGDGR